ncbi:hypothetical protein PF005_g5425 [Phytophthora fragariae]|uniref:Uncharacterized protein n=1 Tax=Phytophthora fragariae TaxID=53985 RepID=A0A6A3LYR7_9STRA|nr:hypothetical protein PF003_g22380 [Phytophthora fragariae]KAE9023180.1 hypothetical protein PF011_g4107 [Phytophthora fragariae]KAE9127751.1 hypothetical protein PF007_g5489 [Phytophthora fragariae]KAE9151303.1 hypothetical protein PF006_g4380 [Phytophthora fragariae]KAE9225718.1 hypothetical protein PF005_g5425 [Phytophthora fragariae]
MASRRKLGASAVARRSLVESTTFLGLSALGLTTGQSSIKHLLALRAGQWVPRQDTPSTFSG